MFHRLRTILVSLALLLSVGGMAAVAPSASAANALDPTTSQICQNAASKSSPVCTTTGNDPIGGKGGILYKVSVILSLIASIGAVVVIIIGGFQYVTAAGDPNKASNARRTIIAAVIGLLVIAAAQAIIAYVLNIVK